MSESTIVVMQGDQTGQELLEEALRVLNPSVTRCELAFETYDLSLENRRARCFIEARFSDGDGCLNVSLIKRAKTCCCPFIALSLWAGLIVLR